ncbi:tRNA-uridine aminocarboxypropyltransferase [Psychrobium sp. nBUS_13]|uniref:tRNA-uridine aminocarboxypropyltransferase n=1 Tax=Psychrobium sp. nBUS_13 TaxID=3395319 RepID=UPI003EBD01C2
MTKRARCPQCNRAIVACFCDTITQIENELSVIILQHTSEVKHAKGTTKIVELSLNNIEVFVGEDFTDNSELKEKLATKKSLLLYPQENAISPSDLASQINENSDIKLSDYQLVAIDGSWKKAFKILQLNPFLSQIPAIGIDAINESDYRIRKSSRSDSLSTLEAVHSVLTTVEGDKFEGLLTSFKAMVDFQIKSMPKDVQGRY